MTEPLAASLIPRGPLTDLCRNVSLLFLRIIVERQPPRCIQREERCEKSAAISRYFFIISSSLRFCRRFQATLSHRTESDQVTLHLLLHFHQGAHMAAVSKVNQTHCDTSDHLCQCSRVERSFTGVYVSFTIFVFPRKAVSVGCK